MPFHLKDQFVHNDLHHENALLYTLPENRDGVDQCLTMNYHYKDDLEFKTNVIPKIIDYGRSFTNFTDTLIKF